MVLLRRRLFYNDTAWFGGDSMKVGDLVILEYKGVDHEEKGRKKIGFVKTLAQGRNEKAKVLWSSGEETWMFPEQLEVL